MKDPDLPVTTNNPVEWIRKAAGKINRLGRSPRFSMRYVTTSTTALDTDEVILCTGALTVTLPGVIEGKRYTIKRLGTGTTTIATTGGQTIDGAATKTLTTQYACLRVYGGTSEWHVDL